MRRGSITLIVALAAAFATVPIGIAATGGTDPSGDVFGQPAGSTGGADIVRATAGRTGDGQIKHTVTVAGSAANPAGNGLIPSVYIELPEETGNTDEANAQAECTVFVGRHRGRLGVFRCGTTERVASARIVRASGSTIRYTFSPRAIRNARSYEWAAVTKGLSTERGSATRHDRLPDGDDIYLVHRVR